MTRHKKRSLKKTSKYKAEKVHITTTVIKIEEQNVLVNDKYKTVFYCESKNNPEGRMCIAWGKTRIIVGSNVELDGRFKDDVFLVWTMTITNDKIMPVEHNPHFEEIRKMLRGLKKQ